MDDNPRLITFWYAPLVTCMLIHIKTLVLVFCVVLLCFFMFRVPCSDVCYRFPQKTMFGSSLPPVVCRRTLYLRYLCLDAHHGVQHMLCCVLFCLCSSCVTYVTSSSGLSIFNCPFGILYRLFIKMPVSSQDTELSCIYVLGVSYCLCIYHFCIRFWNCSDSLVFSFFFLLNNLIICIFFVIYTENKPEDVEIYSVHHEFCVLDESL
jgi:hypothetical protein